jgi:hypothetical protein
MVQSTCKVHKHFVRQLLCCRQAVALVAGNCYTANAVLCSVLVHGALAVGITAGVLQPCECVLNYYACAGQPT